MVAAGRPESVWDPDLELLPYEEVDDVYGDAPIKGRSWIAWVLGAAVLVGIVVLLLRIFGTDSEETATDPALSESSSLSPDGSTQEVGEAPTGVGKRLDLAEQASFEVLGTAPATTDFDGTLVAYEASQMGDGNPTTTWRTDGDATGQPVTITLAQPGVVTRVGLINGYAKQVAGVDWYPNNRRILTATWTFEDGTSVDQTFTERPAMQTMKVAPVQTGTITLTIGSVTTPGSGNLGRDYTAISEISIIGRPAG